MTAASEETRRLRRVLAQKLELAGTFGAHALPVVPPLAIPPAASAAPAAETPKAAAPPPAGRGRRSAADRQAMLDAIAERIAACTSCPLHASRLHGVPGEGNPEARLMFIGEGPGENEDLQGRPFVGRAGELLDRIIAAMGLRREDVFIANIVKCRPPENRAPTPAEAACCTPFLEQQIQIIGPEVLVALGATAAKYLLDTKDGINRLRGQWHDFRGIPLMPTYHPAYLLRAYTPENRRKVWDDMLKVCQRLGITPPKKKA